ncbi:MAG: DUF4351 domain-containing protein [Chloroflexaceae bacterium]|nr:DUF4351 domain-containing protein [Chloroflexaceae bacterium]
MSAFFLEFLGLFFPDVRKYIDPTELEFQPQELFTDLVLGQTYLADVVVKTRYLDQLSYFIIHVEHQTDSEADFPHRKYRYFALLHLKYDRPVYPIVLLSHSSPRRNEPNEYVISFPDLEVLRFRFQVLQLSHLHWQDYVDVPNPVACALMCLMNVQWHERPLVVLASLRLLARLKLGEAKSRLVMGFMHVYIKLNRREREEYKAELAKLAPQEQEEAMELTNMWIEEGIEKGIEKGRAEGLLEGRIEGRRDEALNLTRRLLVRKVGLLPQDLEERLALLALPQMETLIEDSLDFGKVEDLVAWLDTHPPMPDANGNHNGAGHHPL